MKCESVSPFFTPQTNLETPQSLQFLPKLRSLMEKVKTAIANLALHSSDPQVFERHDRQGNVYYQVYDPLSRQSATFGSESEIRYWLEQRYSR